MAAWILIAKDVKYTRQLPAEIEFRADTYECSNCHNRVNDKDGLPEVCPWCGEEAETWNN